LVIYPPDGRTTLSAWKLEGGAAMVVNDDRLRQSILDAGVPRQARYA
jgi:hypothetical protein